MIWLLTFFLAQSFEVASIKPAEPDSRAGRFIRMQGGHQFHARNQTLKTLIGAAYSLNPREISGGPEWADSERFDILAATPGEARPALEEQMAMLRKLLAERFKLTFHREEKEMAVYALTELRGGPKLKESAGPADASPELTNVIFPDHVRLPARNTTIGQFVWMMQRAVLDRPVVDKTGLSGRYDFDLEWAADESQFGGQVPHPADSTWPDLRRALQQQLGLRLEATRGMVEALVIDRAERPGEN
jgi:uncharacterized protein (TIGR03435 family)